jgi:hypothetical protein
MSDGSSQSGLSLVQILHKNIHSSTHRNVVPTIALCALLSCSVYGQFVRQYRFRLHRCLSRLRSQPQVTEVNESQEWYDAYLEGSGEDLPKGLTLHPKPTK